MKAPTDLDKAKFFDKVDKQDNGCWIWTGAKVRNVSKSGKVHKVSAGYGLFQFGKKLYRAHRLSWTWEFGEIPEGMTLDHQCHTNDKECKGGNDCKHRACVNPYHLKLMTRKQNVLSGNTITGNYALKTHCEHGHELIGNNLLPNKTGHRQCRACQVERTRE